VPKVLSYQYKTFIVIAVFSALRFVYGYTLELNADEAYYWTYAKDLQWNYFDHPPIVGWLIRFTTANLLFHNEFFVRLGAIISCAISTWLIFKIGAIVKDERTGWFAVLLYTSSLYVSINTGTIILPDGPLMVFWLASIFLLLKILRSNAETKAFNVLWCLFGITSGLCIMSKVYGVFIWCGVVLYILFINRDWLKCRVIYLAAAITLIIISPIIIWNIQNDFITYRFHSNRISMIGSGVQLKFFFKALFQQISINNPVNVFLIVYNLWLIIKKKILVNKRDVQLLLLCSLPLIFLVLFISLFHETFAHWSGPGFCCLLVLPAIGLAKGKRRDVPNVAIWAFIYLFLIASFSTVMINYFPGTLSLQKKGLKMGQDDLTLDIYGWKDVGLQFDSLYRKDVANKIMPHCAPIVVTNWFPAANIEYYVSSITKQPVYGIGGVDDLHQYYYTNKPGQGLKNGGNAYLIIPSHVYYHRTFGEVSSKFRSVEMPLVITQTRSGIACQYIYVYRLKGFKGDVEK
jgi:hypothetical protein